MHYTKLLLLITCVHFYIYSYSTAIHLTLQEHLAHELNDAAIAKELSTLLLDSILTWKAPTIESKQITSIIAFAFGNRILPNGNRLPGPVNQALADLVVKLHRETHAHVYAQWEIAECIGNQISTEKMSIIYPTLDGQANVNYLSTAGVIAEIIKDVCNPKRLGTVAVVAFNDHIQRCITLAHAACIDAYAPAGYNMPTEYDQFSGQPWTRDRLTYLITDMKARITNYLEKY